MNPFIRTDWAKNVKYIRRAVTIIKLIVIINILLGSLAVCASLSDTGVMINGEAIQNKPGFLTTGSAIFNLFVGIFVMFTAARGLELFADVAEKNLAPSTSQPEPQLTQPNQFGCA